MAKNTLDRIEEDVEERMKVLTHLQENQLFINKIMYALDWNDRRKTTWLKPWLEAQVAQELSEPSELTNIATSLSKGVRVLDWDLLAYKAFKWVSANIRYTRDQDKWGTPEYWETYDNVLSTREGDCESGAVLMYVLCRVMGIPAEALMLMTGSVLGGGHCWLAYRSYTNPIEWSFLDWCYYKTLLPIKTRPKFNIQTRTIHGDDSRYIRIWWCFNEANTYGSFKRTVNKKR
jgi:transglutaminase-like putative cysteine protease